MAQPLGQRRHDVFEQLGGDLHRADLASGLTTLLREAGEFLEREFAHRHFRRRDPTRYPAWLVGVYARKRVAGMSPPYPAEWMSAMAVATRVNTAANEGSECLFASIRLLVRRSDSPILCP